MEKAANNKHILNYSEFSFNRGIKSSRWGPQYR